MRIPEIQRRLNELSVDLQCPELKRLAFALSRRPGQSGPRTSRRVDDAVRKEVMRLRAETDYSQQKIGELVGVNGGRVSEILHGYRR